MNKSNCFIERYYCFLESAWSLCLK